MLITLILLSLFAIGAVGAVDDSVDLADDSLDSSLGDLDSNALTAEEDSMDDLVSPSIDDEVDYSSQDLNEDIIGDSQAIKEDDLEEQNNNNVLSEPSADSFVVEIPDKVDVKETNLGDENYIQLINITVPKDIKANITILEDNNVIKEIKILSPTDIQVNPGGVYHTIENDKIRFACYYFASDLGLKNFTVKLNDGTGSVNKSKVVKFDYELRANSVLAYGDTELRIFCAGSISKVSVHIKRKKYAINSTLIYDDHNFYYHYVKLPKLAIGTHKITLTYSGDDKYPKKTVESSFIVKGVIKFTDFRFDSVRKTVSLALPKNANGYLVVQIFDKNNKSLKSINKKLVNGTAAISLINSGVYGENLRVVAKYTGTDYSVGVEDKDYIIINPKISVPSKMLQGEKKYVSINLPGKEGTLKLYMDVYYNSTHKQVEKTYTAKLVDGKAKISLSKFKAGSKIFFISFTEKLSDGSTVSYLYNDYYDFKILKPLNIVTSSIYYGGSIKIQAYKAGGKPLAYKYISIKINGKFFKKVKTNKNGLAKVKLGSKYTPKKYNITAVYGKNKVSKKIKVKQVLSLKKVTIKKSAKKLILTATLKKGKTPMKKRKVTFRFKGKKYTVKTNKKGIAKVTIKKAVLKTLKAGKKLTYKATYCKTTVKRTVKVKK